MAKNMHFDQIQKEYRDMISTLRFDNDDLKRRLKALNDELSRPSEEVIKLEKEINSIKVPN
jgi:hypothetical protein